ncbi:MAG: IS1595 family transposase [Candidatus Saccharimonadales bacterium]
MAEVSSIIQFYEKFRDEQVCRDYLEQARWDGEPICPHCGSYKTYKFTNGRLFKCGDCKKQFTVRVGTIFEDSKISLQKWFLAVYLATSLKKGISSVQLSKYLGITQKTAWFMLQRIRYAIESGSYDKLGGEVEIDETYVGGKSENRAYQPAKRKEVVFGMVERDGSTTIKHVKSSGARILLPTIKENVKQGSMIYSDQWQAYKTLPYRGYQHAVVNHSEQQYVIGRIYTQNIENVWSQLKRSVYGVYHHVSPKHLQKYCSETEYRYNTRRMTDGERFDDWFGNINKRLGYKELING